MSGAPSSQRQTVTPLRRCRVCYRQLPKAELQRWIRQDGQFVRDEAQKLPGRGYYTCSLECAERLSKIKIKSKLTK
jgi:predicted RNA-binding protein YlxR (DUF448 family)